MNTQAYNVDIFDRDFVIITHFTVDDIEYNFDYLSMVENTVYIAFDAGVAIGQYIYLSNSKREYFGVISGVSLQTNGTLEVRYKPFTSLFTSKILFDTNWQAGAGGTKTLETAIADIIADYFINNTDVKQNITGLSVTTVSATSGWGFNLKTDTKDSHYTIIDFYGTIITRAMTKYRVGVYATPNIMAKLITVEIGVKSSAEHVIESGLPSVVEKNVLINETKSDTNKLVIYNTGNYAEKIIYYKHPDRSYDKTDADRILPVIYDIKSTSAQTGEKTFAQAAQEVADQTFDVESYNNLIELTVMNDDDLVVPSGLSFGQLVSVIANGEIYQSIFTGIEIGERTKLIFGTIRIELTKKLKGVLNG